MRIFVPSVQWSGICIDSMAVDRIEVEAPVSTEEALKRQTKESMDSVEMPDLVYVDELTGLYNRRYLNTKIRKLIDEMGESIKSLCLVMIDVDEFKRFNDTYGHQFGDQVLVQVSNVMKKCVRQDDFVIRYAGDEFTLVLPGIPLEVARKVCERIADHLRNERFLVNGSEENISVTLSLGIARGPEDGSDLGALIEQADRALYCSKHKGRDAISLTTDIPPDLISDSERFSVFPAKEIVGRVGEMQYFADRLGEVLLGKSRFILYEGIPGVGKTRLLDTLAAVAQKDGFVTIIDRCLETQTEQPFGILVKILDKFLMELHGNITRFLQHLSEPELVVVANHIPELALSGTVEEISADSTLSDQDKRCHLYNGLKRLMENVLAEGSVVLVLDDIHWADEATITLFNSILHEEEQTPFCIVGAYNGSDYVQSPQPFHKLLAEGEVFGENDLRPVQPLSEDETGMLLGLIFKGFEKAGKFIRFVYKRTGGNPFFVEEMLKYMLRKGMISWEDQHWKILPVSPEDIPADVTSLVKGRLESLHDEARDVSKDASALGQTVDLDTLKSVVQMSESALLEFLEKAKNEKLLSIENSDKGNFDIQFNTPTMRDIIYQTIPEDKRKNLHERIGEVLEEKSGGDMSHVIHALAYHFKRTEALKKAEEYAQIAAGQASELFCADEVAHYRRESAEEEVEEVDEVEEELIGGALEKEDLQRVCEFISPIRVTVQRVAIYTAKHNVSIGAIDALYQQLEKILKDVDILTISDVEAHIVANRQELDAQLIDKVSEANMVRLMRLHSLRSITLINGLSKEEFTILLSTLAEKQPEPIIEILKGHKVRNVRMNKTKYVEEGAAREINAITPPDMELFKEEVLKNIEEAPPSPGPAYTGIDFDMDPDAVADLLAPITDMDGLKESLLGIASNLEEGCDTEEAAGVRETVAHSLLDRDPLQLAEVLSQQGEGPMAGLELQTTLEGLVKGDEGQRLLKKLSTALVTLRSLSDGEEPPHRNGVAVIETLIKDAPVLPIGADTDEEATRELAALTNKRLVGYIRRLSSGRPIRWSAELREDLPELVHHLGGEGEHDKIQALTRIVKHHSRSASEGTRSEAVELTGRLLKGLRFPGCETVRTGMMTDLLERLHEEEISEIVEAISGVFENQVPVFVQRGQYEFLSKVVHVFSVKYGSDESVSGEKKAVAESVLNSLARDDVLDVLLADVESGDPARQEAARHVLVDLGARTIDPLMEIVKTTQDLRVRKASVSILQEIGPAAFQRALEELTIETHPPTLKNLIHVCEAFGDREEPIEHMTHLLSHTSKLVKLEALRAFGRMKNDASRGILLEQAQSRDPDLQKTAVHLIGLYRYNEAADALVSLLNERRTFVGEDGEELLRVICITLGKLKSELAVPSLEEIVKTKKVLFGKKDAPESVRAAVVWALGEIGSRRALEAVRGLGKGTGPTEREAINLVLSRGASS